MNVASNIFQLINYQTKITVTNFNHEYFITSILTRITSGLKLHKMCDVMISWKCTLHFTSMPVKIMYEGKIFIIHDIAATFIK